MRALLVFLLVLVGLAGLVLGVTYLSVQAHQLPHFLPGYIANSTAKHPTRAYISFGAGAAVLLIALLIGMTGRPKRYGSLR
jgi:hypothetical protein